MLLFTGCGNITDADTSTTGNQPISISSIKLNTAVQITIMILRIKLSWMTVWPLCDKYELIFSRTNEKSELYKLNHRKDVSDGDFSTDGQTTPYPVSGTSRHLAYILKTLPLCFPKDSISPKSLTEPLTSPLRLWPLSGIHSRRPEGSGWCSYSEALPLCSSDGVTIDGQDITLPSDDIQFDVGAIAKGYNRRPPERFSDKKGVKSAIINLAQRPLHRFKARRHSLQDRYPEAFCGPQWNRGCYGYHRKIRCILRNLWEVL